MSAAGTEPYRRDEPQSRRKSIANRDAGRVATFMEVLDTTIANVALPYIAGAWA